MKSFFLIGYKTATSSISINLYTKPQKDKGLGRIPPKQFID